MAFRNYDPKQFVVTFKGILLQGWMDGTFCSVERDEDTYEAHAGADGDVTRVRKHNRIGKCTITLKAESSTNDRLSEVMRGDELRNDGVGELMVKNTNGTTVCHGADAWISKPPVVEGADTASGREWILTIADVDIFVGGALV